MTSKQEQAIQEAGQEPTSEKDGSWLSRVPEIKPPWEQKQMTPKQEQAIQEAERKRQLKAQGLTEDEDGTLRNKEGKEVQQMVGVPLEALQKQEQHNRDAVLQMAARAAHEANRAYCLVLLDNSQVAWEDAPDWQRESIVAGARSIRDNPSTTSKESHENWCLLKRENGWVYGPEKDSDLREHPCLVEYEELPPEQKFKDLLFGAVVRGVFGIKQ